MALEVIEAVRVARPDLVLRVVDLSKAPEVAVRYRVMATPAIAIDGRLAFTGVPKPEALRARILGAGG